MAATSSVGETRYEEELAVLVSSRPPPFCCPPRRGRNLGRGLPEVVAVNLRLDRPGARPGSMPGAGAADTNVRRRVQRETRPFFADLGPPQTFALRADEILGNERQTVWRIWASAASVASACSSISRADHAAGLRDPSPQLDRPPSRAIERDPVEKYEPVNCPTFWRKHPPQLRWG